jgi:hypothetical protein
VPGDVRRVNDGQNRVDTNEAEEDKGAEQNVLSVRSILHGIIINTLVPGN